MESFVKNIFLLITFVFSFWILLLVKSLPNAEILTQGESSKLHKYFLPAKKVYEFTDFSETFNKSGKPFWNSIKPSFICPLDLLSRVGSSEDGGKWTCGLSNLGKLSIKNEKAAPCVVYSFGVSNDSFFEAEVLETTHCDVYAYDPFVDTIAKPLTSSNPRVHFTALGIGDVDSGNIRTLKTLMKQNGGHEWIDILKMDVEYAEYASLENILKEFAEVGDENGNWGGGLPFGQLLVEMHVYKAMSIKEAENVVDLFKRLEARGLRIFYKEINPVDRGNKFCEFSFMNTNEFSLGRFLGNGKMLV